MKPKKPEVQEVVNPGMSQAELIEQLSHFEHASWSKWMSYLFSKCQRQLDGSMLIPTGLVVHWMRQANTSYADLSEKEKQSDREEVAHILPIIEAYRQPNLLTPERVNAALNTPIKHSPFGEQLEKETWK